MRVIRCAKCNYFDVKGTLDGYVCKALRREIEMTHFDGSISRKLLPLRVKPDDYCFIPAREDEYHD